MIKDAYGNVRFYGVYRGVVVNAQDPTSAGRIKVKVPQVLLDQTTDWAWPIQQPGVTRTLPEVGQGVFVMFEGGDPSFPIWTGTFTAGTPVEDLGARYEDSSSALIGPRKITVKAGATGPTAPQVGDVWISW